jgi:hypothetical protein
MDKTIRVWRWEDAPEKYRRLSEHGGDEDWVAFVPAALKDEWIGWAEEGGPFGYCSVSEHEVDGGRVLIGARA